jgi:urease accessory protein
MTDLPAPVETVVDPRWRQRANACLRASFARAGTRTEAERTFETGGLRWRFPRPSGACEAAIVNTGGGVAGGDVLHVALWLKEAAEVEATTPAAEKIYRSDGAPARIETRLALESRARLDWLPQETLLFEGAWLERRLEVDIAAEARLLLVESIVFGRLAMGEGRIDARLKDSWRVRRNGRLVFADETRLERAGATLDRRAVGGGARALATIVAAAPDVEARLPDLRAAIDAGMEGVEAGASAFDGLIVARLLSPSPSRLRAAAIASILALGGRKPRLWQ